MNKICDECETVAHCTKHGCIPKVSAKDAMKLAPQPAQQREPDLSGLKPSTQEVIKGWIEDGTFIERAIGAMQEQEAENMRLEKMAAPQPAQRKPLSVDEIFEAIRPLYSSDKAAWLAVNHSKDEYRLIEAKHGIKENT